MPVMPCNREGLRDAGSSWWPASAFICYIDIASICLGLKPSTAFIISRHNSSIPKFSRHLSYYKTISIIYHININKIFLRGPKGVMDSRQSVY